MIPHGRHRIYISVLVALFTLSLNWSLTTPMGSSHAPASLEAHSHIFKKVHLERSTNFSAGRPLLSGLWLWSDNEGAALGSISRITTFVASVVPKYYSFRPLYLLLKMLVI